MFPSVPLSQSAASPGEANTAAPSGTGQAARSSRSRGTPSPRQAPRMVSLAWTA